MTAQATVAAREGEEARAGQGLDPRGARDRVLPAPPLGRGRGRVPRRARALADRRLRPLRARPGAREAGPRGRGERPLQARELDGPRRASSYAARIRELDVAPRARRRPARLARAGHARRRDRRRPLRAARRRGHDDDAAAADRLAGKVARLRIFEGDDGKFDRSLLDTGGAALVVSQFTLIADSDARGQPAELLRARRGPRVAEPLYERFCAALRELGVHGRDRRLRRPDGRSSSSTTGR